MGITILFILLITLISICVGYFQYKISKDDSFKPIFTILYAIMLLVIAGMNFYIFFLFVFLSLIIEIINKVWLNKLKLRKRLITFAIMLCSLIVICIVSHITPHNAVRAHLFATGHPIAALTTGVSEIDDNEFLNSKIHEDEKCYHMTKSIPSQYSFSNSRVSSCVVTKKGFLYYATYVDYNFRDI